MNNVNNITLYADVNNAGEFRRHHWKGNIFKGYTNTCLAK